MADAAQRAAAVLLDEGTLEWLLADAAVAHTLRRLRVERGGSGPSRDADADARRVAAPAPAPPDGGSNRHAAASGAGLRERARPATVGPSGTLSAPPVRPSLTRRLQRSGAVKVATENHQPAASQRRLQQADATSAGQVEESFEQPDWETRGVITPAPGLQSAWTRQSRPTPHGNYPYHTGPDAAYDGSYCMYLYMYTESVDLYNEQFVLSLSQPFDPGVIYVVSFWYHMYGNAMGALSVEMASAAVGSGAQGASDGTWTPVWSVSGQQQTASSDPWRQAEVAIIPDSASSVDVWIKGVTGPDVASDMSIDAVRVSVCRIDGGLCAWMR